MEAGLRFVFVRPSVCPAAGVSVGLSLVLVNSKVQKGKSQKVQINVIYNVIA